MQGKGFCFTIIDLHTNTQFFILDTQSSSSQIRGLPRLEQREAELKGDCHCSIVSCGQAVQQWHHGYGAVVSP